MSVSVQRGNAFEWTDHQIVLRENGFYLFKFQAKKVQVTKGKWKQIDTIAFISHFPNKWLRRFSELFSPSFTLISKLCLNRPSAVATVTSCICVWMLVDKYDFSLIVDWMWVELTQQSESSHRLLRVCYVQPSKLIEGHDRVLHPALANCVGMFQLAMQKDQNDRATLDLYVCA